MRRSHGIIIDPILDPPREGRGVDGAAFRGPGIPIPAVEEAIKGAFVVWGLMAWV
jgi:hypothetical protein